MPQTRTNDGTRQGAVPHRQVEQIAAVSRAPKNFVERLLLLKHGIEKVGGCAACRQSNLMIARARKTIRLGVRCGHD